MGIHRQNIGDAHASNSTDCLQFGREHEAETIVDRSENKKRLSRADDLEMSIPNGLFALHFCFHLFSTHACFPLAHMLQGSCFWLCASEVVLLLLLPLLAAMGISVVSDADAVGFDGCRHPYRCCHCFPQRLEAVEHPPRYILFAPNKPLFIRMWGAATADPRWRPGTILGKQHSDRPHQTLNKNNWICQPCRTWGHRFPPLRCRW